MNNCGSGFISVQPCSWLVGGFSAPTVLPDLRVFIGTFTPLVLVNGAGFTPGPVGPINIPGGTAVGSGFTGSTGGTGSTFPSRDPAPRPFRPRPLDPITPIGGSPGGVTPVGGNADLVGGTLRPTDPPGPDIVSPNNPIGNPTVIIDPIGGGGDIVGSGFGIGGDRIVEE